MFSTSRPYGARQSFNSKTRPPHIPRWQPPPRAEQFADRMAALERSCQPRRRRSMTDAEFSAVQSARGQRSQSVQRDRIRPVKVRAAQLLSDGLSTKAVAKRLGPSQRTIQRWIQLGDLPHLLAQSRDNLAAKKRKHVRRKQGRRILARIVAFFYASRTGDINHIGLGGGGQGFFCSEKKIIIPPREGYTELVQSTRRGRSPPDTFALAPLV